MQACAAEMQASTAAPSLPVCVLDIASSGSESPRESEDEAARGWNLATPAHRMALDLVSDESDDQGEALQAEPSVKSEFEAGSQAPEPVRELLDDAPPGHPVHHMMKITRKSDGCDLIAFRHGSVHFQVTVFRSGGDYEHAKRLARLCYMKFEQGASKEEVTQYRNFLYTTLAASGLHPKMPGQAVRLYPRLEASQDVEEKVMHGDTKRMSNGHIRWDAGDRRFELKLQTLHGRTHFQVTAKAAGNSQANAERIAYMCYEKFERGFSKEEVKTYRDQLYHQILLGEPLDVPVEVLARIAQPSTCRVARVRALRNKDFCEVCQKTGRLLLCDTCPRAFHARCVEKFVDHQVLAQRTRWTCPVCTHGADVLHGLASSKHLLGDPELRMVDAARRDRKQRRAVERRRDAFLGEHLELLEAMATKSTLTRIQRIKEAGSVLDIGAPVDVTGADGSTYRATVLAHPTPHLPSYIVTNTETKAQGIVERQYLSEVKEPGECDKRDFLSCMRKPVLEQGVALKEYQVAGVNWLIHACLNRCGGILADDMGLGKTVQALACLSYLRSSGALQGPFLIVAPLSCVGNWVREAKRFVPHLSVAKLCGSAHEKKRALDDDELWFGLKDIVITTYETTVGTEDFLQQHFWSALVLDEAHRIKNESSSIREALDAVKCASRVLLTGTPLQNTLGELFALIRFLWPDVLLRLPDSLQNATRGAEPGASEALVRQLRGLLHMLMLRRLKDDVVQLPPKVIRDVWLPLTPCQVTRYKALLQGRREAEKRSLSVMLKFLSCLRQVCCHPCCLVTTDQDCADLKQHELPICDGFLQQSSKLLFLEKLLKHLHMQNMCISPRWRRAFQERRSAQEASSSQSSSPQHASASTAAAAPLSAGTDAALLLGEAHPWKAPHDLQRSKQQETGDLKHPDAEEHDMARPHKVLIFSQFHSCLDLLETFCKWHGWRTLRLDGSTHRILRELDLRDFNSDDEDIFIYLLSTRAGGLGINLASANHVVLFDHDWNPQIDHQAIDRAHRITQERVVTVYRLIQEWSVEERLVARQEEKLRMERSVVEACGSAGRVGEEEPLLNSGEKERLSAAEVSEMLHYGEEAMQQFDGEHVSDQPLRWFLERVRRPMLKPHPAASSTATIAESERREGTVAKRAGADDLLHEASPQKKRVKHMASSGMVPPMPKEQDAIVCWTASGRAVRQPAQFSAALTSSPKATSKKLVLRHCRSCFVCGNGSARAPRERHARDGAEPDSSPELRCTADAGSPDLFCTICPKAYHASCLRPEALMCQRGGRWSCGWHTCADCGRSPSMCGGMLITCMKCPTALCYDCFPPNFRRMHPPDCFWADLNDRGWQASPEKMVFFLCNSCREAEERAKQQEMQAEELLARNRERQRAAKEERKRLAQLKRIAEEEEQQLSQMPPQAIPEGISPRVRIRGKQSF